MKTLKKILLWLKEPRIWWFILVAVMLVAAIAGSVLFLVFGAQGTATEFIGYIFYFIAAALLAYTVYCIIKLAPGFKHRAKEWTVKHEFTKKLFGQYGFCTIVFAAVSFVIGTANAAVNLTLGIMWESVWFIALGVYYFLLTTMRGVVLIFHRRKRKYSEEKTLSRSLVTYLICGVCLSLLSLALSTTVWEIVGEDKAFERPGLLIYVAAAYTFYKVIMSVYNFAKARKNDDMTVRAVRNINLADALVSVLALQTAMFREFSNGADLGYANAVVGAIVCVLTAAIGIFMTVNASIKLRNKEAKANE